MPLTPKVPEVTVLPLFAIAKAPEANDAEPLSSPLIRATGTLLSSTMARLLN